jgi:hypothetical protein
VALQLGISLEIDKLPLTKQYVTRLYKMSRTWTDSLGEGIIWI